jgi:tRNA pseudouridine55 synthase
VKRRPSGLEGAVVVNKPSGCTSHDVVGAVRRALGERRVGHGGTLDPDATGVLVLAVGPATRLLRFVSDLDKSYTAEVVLGIATSTLDASGEVTEQVDMSTVTLEDVVAAARTLTGVISQTPPMVSAIRVGGRRLYELAREGIEVDRAPRTVTVSRFDVGPGSDPGTIAISVDCSSGTYVRSLAADLGTALGGVAHLRDLVRTRIGPFSLADACALDDVDAARLGPPIDLVRHLEEVVVLPDVASMVVHGRVLDRAALGAVGDGPWAVVADGRLLAIYEAHLRDLVKPVLVYAPAGGDHTGPSVGETREGEASGLGDGGDRPVGSM